MLSLANVLVRRFLAFIDVVATGVRIGHVGQVARFGRIAGLSVWVREAVGAPGVCAVQFEVLGVKDSSGEGCFRRGLET